MSWQMYFNNVVLRKLKVCVTFLLLFGVLVNLLSCGSDGGSSSTEMGFWQSEPTIDAGKRTRPVIFNIGESLYLATGFNGTNGKVFFKDLWIYDADNKTWVKKADLPEDLGGVPRSGAVAFSANGKGYVGLGYDGSNYLKDFYAYDPQDNTWARVADFPGVPRDGAIAFNIDNKGYVGGGNDANLEYKDFYQYDDVNDEWISKPSILSTERTNAFCFVIDGKAYVGGGSNNNTLINEFYEYDPIGGANSTGVWNKKNDLLDDKNDTDGNDKGYTIARENAATFVVNGKGYVVGGKRSNQLNSQTWEYNPATDTWKKMNDFTGPAKLGGIGYSIGNLGYYGAGTSGSSYYNDLYSFDPTLPAN